MSESNPEPKSKVPWIVGILLLILALPFSYLILYSMNTKTGVEFSPDDFTVREFSYTKVDWLNWTMAGMQYRDETSIFHQSLIDDAWIARVTKTEKTWHLISDNLTDDDSPDFDARILNDYLEMEFWSDWNDEKKNTKKAKKLWPAVAALARNNTYWAIPDLMDLAIDQQSLTNQSFSDRVDAIAFDALFQNGKQLVGANQFEEAEQAFTSAKNFGSSQQLSDFMTQVTQKLKDRSSTETDAQEPQNERP
jgi:hypothetical protein